MLASSGATGNIILWDVARGQPLNSSLIGHTDVVHGLVFGPDSQTLASGSQDRTIILWDVSLESWQARACRRANCNLTQEEWQQFFGNQPYRATWPDLQVA